MTHTLKTEMFSQTTEHSGGVILLPLTPLFSFVTFHLKGNNSAKFLQSLICNAEKNLLYAKSGHAVKWLLHVGL